MFLPTSTELFINSVRDFRCFEELQTDREGEGNRYDNVGADASAGLDRCKKLCNKVWLAIISELWRVYAIWK